MKKFDLVMTLLVRDEEDIIAFNIEYHRSQGVEFFIVMDNLSTDDTAAILGSYEEKGILRYIFQERDDYSQGKWVTEMARMAAVEYGARWVINNDADEFWWPLKSNSLRQCLLAIPSEYNQVEAWRHNFVPVKDASGKFYERMTYRQAVSVNPLGGPLPAKVCHRGLKDVVVAQGNHSVEGFGAAKTYKQAIEILHFPFRNIEQYENKIIKGGRAYERNAELSPEVGKAWRQLYDDYRSHGRLPLGYIPQPKTTVQLESDVREGLLIEDRRLKDYMAQIMSTERLR